MEFLNPLLKLTWVMIAIAARCGACSIFCIPIDVAPDFRVKVEDRGRPVKGLPVNIKGYTAVTDENGFALFRGVGAGAYGLAANHDDWDGAGTCIHVSSDGPANVIVPLKWPTFTPAAVRSLRGTIRGPDFLPGQPQPKLSLDLLEARSGRKLKGLQSNDRGEFDFETTAPGMYFINLNPSGLIGWSREQITGQIVVDVDQGAPTDSLDLDLAWTSCGLVYSDQSKCPRDELRVDRLVGHVADSNGASIARAKISLTDATGTLVEDLQSDREGNFASPRDDLVGAYNLAVSFPGFAHYRGILRLDPSIDPTRNASLAVSLGIVGTCAATNPR